MRCPLKTELGESLLRRVLKCIRMAIVIVSPCTYGAPPNLYSPLFPSVRLGLGRAPRPRRGRRRLVVVVLLLRSDNVTNQRSIYLGHKLTTQGRPSPGRLRSRLIAYVECHVCMSV